MRVQMCAVPPAGTAGSTFTSVRETCSQRMNVRGRRHVQALGSWRFMKLMRKWRAGVPAAIAFVCLQSFDLNASTSW